MRLSENFDLSEFTRTNVKANNNPEIAHIENIKALTENVLQPVRKIYGKSISITSGFRSSEVNKKVGGAATSQHSKGEAADLVCEDKTKLFEIIKNLDNFDQLIWEYGNDKSPDWVHVSYSKSRCRKQILRAIKQNGKTKYIPF
jgi:hypothetical protein